MVPKKCVTGQVNGETAQIQTGRSRAVFQSGILGVHTARVYINQGKICSYRTDLQEGDWLCQHFPFP